MQLHLPGLHLQVLLGFAVQGGSRRLTRLTLDAAEVPDKIDLVTIDALARPDLDGLATRLNELEGTSTDDDQAWRAQRLTGASPELWFGVDDHASYAEHAPALRPSRLEPTVVRSAIADALRMALVLPE